MNIKIRMHYIFVVLFLLNACEKKIQKSYNIEDAPMIKKKIADYENLFTKREYNELLKKIAYIENNYHVENRILTVTSFKGKYRMNRKSIMIWDIDPYKDRVIAFRLSVKEKFFHIWVNEKMASLINSDDFVKRSNLICKKYFDSKKYYQAFKEVLEMLEGELQKNILMDL